MKKTFTLIVLFLFIILLPKAKAQVIMPDGEFSLAPVTITVNGESVEVLTDDESSLVVRTADHLSPVEIFTTDGTLKGIANKTRPGGHNQIVVVSIVNGVYAIEIYSVAQIHPLTMIKDTSYTVDLTVSSGYVIGKAKGDDIYCTFSGMFAVLRTGAPHWAWDTAGLNTGGYVTDFDLDTAQNVYAVNGSYLYYQTATGNTFTKVVSYPASTASYVLVDKWNRVIVSAGNQVYVGTNNASTWNTPPTLPGNFGILGEDAFGNIYTTDRSYAYRSTDGGATWTRIDQGIRSQVMDTTLFPLITGISGDTTIYAGTAVGMFASADQGTTWQPVNQGIRALPNGYFHYNSDNRQVTSTDLGIFTKNATDTMWTQTFPTGGLYLQMGTLHGDSLGNLWTVQTWNGNSITIKSTDRGATWQTDTAGLAQVPQPQFSTFNTDEYGNGHMTGQSNGTYLIYAKAPAGSWTIDTAGIGTDLQTFSSVQGYVSDRAGYLYEYGHNNAALSASSWRRPVTGGSWVPDTAGLGHINLTLAKWDHNGGIWALNWSNHVGLYHRGAAGWVTVPYPSNIPSYLYGSALTGDSTGALMVSFYTNNNNSGAQVGLGIYCTHDLGTTWSLVPGLDSAYVNGLLTFGDTSYILSTSGLYQMTCNGVVITATGVPVVNADEQAIQLYPNPASSICHVTVGTAVAANSTLAIQDLTGRVVKTIAVNGNDTSFRTGDMGAGIYLCTLMSGGKILNTKKLVVE